VAAPPVERPEVRRYRFLLQATDPAVMERLHREALSRLDPLTRATILRTAQERLLSGRDLTVDDVPRIARLVTMGERGTPGILVSALPDMSLVRLATIVGRSAEAEDLLTGYATWDGSEAVTQRRSSPPAASAAFPGPAAVRASRGSLVQPTVATGRSGS
jgi:hypothetical protein